MDPPGWVIRKESGSVCVSVDLEQEEAALRADLEVGGESGAEDG